MTVEKMFWDVWRSLGGSSTSKGPPSSSSSISAQRTRYNRLKSSDGSGGPTKSISQPANLTGLCSTTIYSSSESLEETPQNANAHVENEGKDLSGAQGLSSITPKGNGKKRPSRGNTATGSFMKHSISSFFPFTSCASTNPQTNETSSQNSGENPQEKSFFALGSPTTGAVAVPSSSSTTSLTVDQQKESSNNRAGFFSNIYHSGTSGSASASGNSRKGISLFQSSTGCRDDDNRKGKQDSWDQDRIKEVPSQNQDIICEDDISDLDDEVENLTCDVCDRAFPTLSQLSFHQRKKRHFGCLQCDSIFPSQEVLEYHREQMQHFDYAIPYEEDGTDFFESDDENGLRYDEECDDEERERLLL